MNTQDTFYAAFPTQAQVDSLFASFDSQNAEAIENASYRAANYYNCVDDYSYGGICDRAADQARQRRELNRSQLVDQLKEGKPYTETFKTAVLLNSDGVIVSERIVNGRFGECWIIKGEGEDVSFIGVAKKQDTYIKKGYRVATREMVAEYYYTVKTCKSGLVIKGRMLSNTIVEEMPKIQSTQTHRAVWFVENSN